MQLPPLHITRATLRRCCAAAALALPALPALALYKVVGPDGSITYTDRPPVTSNAKITPFTRNGAAAAPDASLPFELRQVTQRYPVTLYTSTDCPPCDSGRQMLQQRGVPFTERRIASEEDAVALERVVGGRTVPALTIGQQALRGLSQPEWTSFLDAAGYPKESRLPRNYQAPAAAPLVERAAAPRPA
ncbi:MAG: glutaredoxin family protein, partial [Rubrivivax sp.]